MYILLLVKESWGGAEGNVRDILEPLARGSSTLGCCHSPQGTLPKFHLQVKKADSYPHS